MAAAPSHHEKCATMIFAVSLIVLSVLPVNGNSFLKDTSQPNTIRHSQGVNSAVKSVLACGGPVEESTLEVTKAMLLPLWRTLPKNKHGLVNRRSLRYLAHRYFTHNFNIRIRGFEPTRAVNNSVALAILSDGTIGRNVEISEDPPRVARDGFSLEDARDLVVIIQQRIFESDSALLEHVFWEHGRSRDQLLSTSQFVNLLYSYIYHWVFGADIHGKGVLSALHNLTTARNSHLLSNSNIIELAEFVQGQVMTLEWLRHNAPTAGDSKKAWMNMYTFSDARRVATGITSSFGVYSASTCRSMKESLVQMDPRNMGRAPLSKFYAATIHDKQQFAESQTYLRELGALDETSILLGKQVIIPNYLQAASNCMISTPEYHICCANECDDLLQAIESALGVSAASPDTILGVVGNLTLQMQNSLDDDEFYALDRGLAAKLEEIASNNNGHVQVHGRLFLQWLHYAFPRECAFPHKAGTVVLKTAREYGNVSIETWDNMRERANDPVEAFAHNALAMVDKDQLEWMTQWTADEELIGEIGQDLQWPDSMQQGKQLCAGGTVLLLFFLLGGIANKGFAEFCQTPAQTGSSRAYYV